VFLVGHSMGGIAITQAAGTCHERIGALVYLHRAHYHDLCAERVG
jgi:pimeloyl-ACP methyl ester carboxylesterase